MSQPVIDLIPIRNAVRSDAYTKLYVLLRITPPTIEEHPDERPPINLGLVLDRSGSMSEGGKMTFAKEAAVYAVEALLPTDRVSVTIFDDVVETIVPNTLLENREHITDAIKKVQPRSTTALYDGWNGGKEQVFAHLLPIGTNRVLLLSDGVANVGLTNLDDIATKVKQAAEIGVSTSTIGVGADYNEMLMEAMATSGDGRYYYVSSSDQLGEIFHRELKALRNVTGSNVSLSIAPHGELVLKDMLNDLPVLPSGDFKLPNLVFGTQLFIVVKLKVPPLSGENDLCNFRLAWATPDNPEKQEMLVTLRLPAVTKAEWKSQAKNQEVLERKAILKIARSKNQIELCIRHGDRDGASAALSKARQILESTPDTYEMQIENSALCRLEEQFNAFEDEEMIKDASYSSYERGGCC